jgi:hypothetical protein
MTIVNRLDKIERYQQTTARPGAILWGADYCFGPDVDLPGAGDATMWRWGQRLMTAAEVAALQMTHDVMFVEVVIPDDNQE